jgi:hypothetical protein
MTAPGKLSKVIWKIIVCDDVTQWENTNPKMPKERRLWNAVRNVFGTARNPIEPYGILKRKGVRQRIYGYVLNYLKNIIMLYDYFLMYKRLIKLNG